MEEYKGLIIIPFEDPYNIEDKNGGLVDYFDTRAECYKFIDEWVKDGRPV